MAKMCRQKGPSANETDHAVTPARGRFTFCGAPVSTVGQLVQKAEGLRFRHRWACRVLEIGIRRAKPHPCNTADKSTCPAIRFSCPSSPCWPASSSSRLVPGAGARPFRPLRAGRISESHLGRVATSCQFRFEKASPGRALHRQPWRVSRRPDAGRGNGKPRRVHP